MWSTRRASGWGTRMFWWVQKSWRRDHNSILTGPCRLLCQWREVSTGKCQEEKLNNLSDNTVLFIVVLTKNMYFFLKTCSLLIINRVKLGSPAKLCIFHFQPGCAKKESIDLSCSHFRVRLSSNTRLYQTYHPGLAAVHAVNLLSVHALTPAPSPPSHTLLLLSPLGPGELLWVGGSSSTVLVMAAIAAQYSCLLNTRFG